MYEDLEARAADDPERVLTEVGKKLLKRVLAEDATTANRLAVAHGRIGNLGRIFYDAGPGKAIEAFTRYIDAATKAGRLRADHPGAAAHHLLALLESEIAYRRRLQFDDAISASEIDQCVGRAVTVFLAAYAAPRTSDKAS